MTEALETAMRGALLQYARVRKLKEYEGDEGDAGCSEKPAPAGNVEDSSAQCAKKSKMIRVARMLVDSNPRVRNKGLAADATGSVKLDELKLMIFAFHSAWSSLLCAASLHIYAMFS